MAKEKPRRQRKTRSVAPAPKFEAYTNIYCGNLVLMSDDLGRLYRVNIESGTYTALKQV